MHWHKNIGLISYLRFKSLFILYLPIYSSIYHIFLALFKIYHIYPSTLNISYISKKLFTLHQIYPSKRLILALINIQFAEWQKLRPDGFVSRLLFKKNISSCSVNNANLHNLQTMQKDKRQNNINETKFFRPNTFITFFIKNKSFSFLHQWVKKHHKLWFYSTPSVDFLKNPTRRQKHIGHLSNLPEGKSTRPYQ
jgi:hypothetical protein